MQQLSDFSKAKVGDPVESFKYGFGKIVNTQYIFPYRIVVLFENKKQLTYTIDGRLLEDDSRSDLYYSGIPEFPVPERPKVKVKKTIWVNVYHYNGFCKKSNYDTGYVYLTKEEAEKDHREVEMYIGTYPLEIEVEE